MSIKSFFNKLKEENIDVTVKSKDFMVNIDGDGIGGKVSPDALQRGYDGIKKISAKKGVEVIDNTEEEYVQLVDSSSEEHIEINK